MLRPFDPHNTDLMKFDRIVSDSGTGLLWFLTFFVVYAVFLMVQGAIALPKFILHSTAEAVHGFAARFAAHR